MQSIPVELLDIILSYCHHTDLFNLRLTSHALCYSSTPIAFSQFNLSCFTYSLERLQALSRSHLAKHLKHITVYSNVVSNGPGSSAWQYESDQIVQDWPGAAAEYDRLEQDQRQLLNSFKLDFSHFNLISLCLRGIWYKDIQDGPPRTTLSLIMHKTGHRRESPLGILMKEVLRNSPKELEIHGAYDDNWHLDQMHLEKLVISGVKCWYYDLQTQAMADWKMLLSPMLVKLTIRVEFEKLWSTVLSSVHMPLLRRFEASLEWQDDELITFLEKHDLEELRLVQCLVEDAVSIMKALPRMQLKRVKIKELHEYAGEWLYFPNGTSDQWFCTGLGEMPVLERVEEEEESFGCVDFSWGITV